MHGKFYLETEIKFADKPRVHNFRDIDGAVFGRLTVLGYAGSVTHRGGSVAQWYCRCQCNRIVRTNGTDLRSGKSKSCGCLADDLTKHRLRTHGKSRSPEHAAYYSARRRCTCPNVAAYPDYGGRGIEFRFNSFDEFYELMGDRPSKKHSLDRIDHNGHYEPGNLRWASKEQQMGNRRVTKVYSLGNDTKSLVEWCGGSRTAKYSRTKRRLRLGYCFSCALNNSNGDLCPHR